MARRHHRLPADRHAELVLIINTQVEDEAVRERLRAAADELNQAWVDTVKAGQEAESRMLRAR